MRKYFNRKNKIFTMGMILTLFFAFLVIFANNITPYDPVKMEISNKFIKPCIEHPFGTDHMGLRCFKQSHLWISCFSSDSSICSFDQCIPRNTFGYDLWLYWRDSGRSAHAFGGCNAGLSGYCICTGNFYSSG